MIVTASHSTANDVLILPTGSNCICAETEFSIEDPLTDVR